MALDDITRGILIVLQAAAGPGPKAEVGSRKEDG
jgi:hypothetical protein